jgi:flagellar basal body-associated protein FliL
MDYKEADGQPYVTMGLLIWIIIGIIILAIIGLGWKVFVSGVFKGANKIVDSTPTLKNIANKSKEYIVNTMKNVTKELNR